MQSGGGWQNKMMDEMIRWINGWVSCWSIDGWMMDGQTAATAAR